MNTKQIIAELRRSAVEDASPWHGCDYTAWRCARLDWLFGSEQLLGARKDHIRTFYLLVAEAMETT